MYVGMDIDVRESLSLQAMMIAPIGIIQINSSFLFKFPQILHDSTCYLTLPPATVCPSCRPDTFLGECTMKLVLFLRLTLARLFEIQNRCNRVVELLPRTT